MACMRNDEFPVNSGFYCDAEILNKKGDKFLTDTASLLDGGKLQTDKEARSGSYSVLTIPKKAFAFSYHIKNTGPDWYFKLSVWRKSKDGRGVLVAAAKDPKDLYIASSNAVKIDENGWEKIELEVYTPPNFNYSELNFYVWNNSEDTIYFDDISIKRLSGKKYPEYDEQALVIMLDTSEYIKLYEKRKHAFDAGILQTEDDDWVKAIIFDDDKMMKADLRLKGDWLDHLRGDKWSYRIKLKKDNTWKRLRTFSLQTPVSRGYLNEWVSHKFYDTVDVLTTRYGFIPLELNNKKKGLYAWEEHFEKQLLESRNRREGPIIKFSEDAFWQIQKYSIHLREKWPLMPYYETARILPFKQAKTMRSEVLRNQFLNGQKLAYQYKNHLQPPGMIFDLDKLAKYYAMLEITQARHGMAWHNQRLYFNPVLCKLEPIAFDGFADYSKFKPGIEENMAYKALTVTDSVENHQYLIYKLFTDSAFLIKYMGYLEKYSNAEFVDNVLGEIKNEIVLYDSLLRLEFQIEPYDPLLYKDIANDIKSYLPELKRIVVEMMNQPSNHLFAVKHQFTDSTSFEDTPKFFVNAYLEEKGNDSVKISVYNYFPGDILLLGTSRKGNYVDHFIHPEPKLKAYNGNIAHKEIILSDTNALYLHFMTPNGLDTYTIEILPWPHPHGLTSQQELLFNADLKDYNNFMVKRDHILVIKQGYHTINYPVIIPSGYQLQFEPGTILDFVEGAMFISYSPVSMLGTDAKKIKITSSDFSANGFTILQAKQISELNHVVFENLNTLDYKGWTLTGAVTFYESDVDIRNTLFYRNQCEDALNTIRSEFRVSTTEFDNIYGDAFDSDFCNGIVSNSRFTNIANDAIDFSGSQIIIENTEIIEAKDKGISGGEDSYLEVYNTHVFRSNIGIASKDLSLVKVDKSSIVDCNYGLVLLQKKPEYGPAQMILTNTVIDNTKTFHLVETDSKVILDGIVIEGDEKNLAKKFY